MDYGLVYNVNVGWWRLVPLLGVKEIWMLLDVNNSRSHIYPVIQFMISDETYMDVDTLCGRLEVAFQNQFLLDFPCVSATSSHFKSCDGCLIKNSACDLYNTALRHYVYCSDSECKICKSARSRLSYQVIKETKVYIDYVNGGKKISYNPIQHSSDLTKIGG